MSRREAWRRVLDIEVARWSAMSYAQLIAQLRDVEHYEIECELKTYQVEVELLEKTERYVHVLVAVDDGSLPASIVPSCRSFVRHKADSDYGRDSVVTEDRH